ncbi:MAG TPA: alpha-galactosidase [Rhizomicrobium sp.]|nr:alpha-galactosidase [Rhizomicrobium sp.]
MTKFYSIGRLAFAAVAFPALAHAEAHFDPATRTFRLDGGQTSYVFGVNSAGALQSLYWGPQLAASDTLKAVTPPDLSGFDPSSSITPQEYPGWGGPLYTEPALKLAYPDGVRDVVLTFRSGRADGNSITVEMSDIRQPLNVSLLYTIDPSTGIVGRSAIIRNETKATVRIDQAFSAAWSLPPQNDYHLHYLTGRWAAEWTLQDRALTQGATVIESRRGSTGMQANPWFAIDRAGISTEENGPVWFGALAWSGSWRISVDRDPLGDVRVAGGFNPFDFAYQLKPGESLETPVFYGGYSNQGMGGASRLLHRFEITNILPQKPEPKLRPVLYNSWEATEFAVDEKGQMALAEKAARIGVERFVMDDGWFGARNSDHAGLGDWTVNPAKFPNGLKPLIDKVHSLGMEFGLWVEPEMVNPDSELYRAHPDWVMNFPGRPRSEGRNQLVLNLARPDVRDYILRAMDDLLSKNDIQFLKWDYNRNWSEPGWPEVDSQSQPEIYVTYVKNLYGLMTELRRRHPKLEIEDCSGGAGRVDLGILSLTDQVWASDNTDPFDRLSIQDGFTHAYAPGVMMDWVTDSPNWVNNRSTSLNYRFLSAMQGGLGIGANLNKWSDAEFTDATRLVAAYKHVRKTVQQGDLYRLIRPEDPSGRFATFYVSPDKRQAVLFAFLHSSTKLDQQPAIQVRGLDPQKAYRVRPVESASGAESQTQSGAYWMGHGVEVPMTGDFQAKGLVFEGQ